MKPQNAIFISKEGLSTFWFLLAAGAVVWSGIYVRNLVVKAGLRPQFLLTTNSDVIVMKPPLAPEHEEEITKEQTRLAMDSIFNRSATGLDSPERCKKLLSPEAWSRVETELIETQKEAFSESRMHQKVEIENIELHPQRTDDAVLASVTGQLIRTGVLDGKLFNEVWSVRAEFMWVPNGSLRDSGRYPLSCAAFTFSERPVASTLQRTAKADKEAAPEAPATDTEGVEN